MLIISSLMVWLWRRWQSAIHSINGAIAFVLMSVTYIIAVTPVAFGFKIFTRDVLDRGLGDPHAKSYWKKTTREQNADDIRRVQRQY